MSESQVVIRYTLEMTLQEKYIALAMAYIDHEVKPYKNGVKYVMPCPFCSPLLKKEWKKKQKNACLLYHQESFSYKFICHRKKSAECFNVDGKTGTLSFHVFLERLNPSLHKQYLQEKEQRGSTGKGHNAPKVDYEAMFKQQTQLELKRRKEYKRIQKELKQAWDALSPSMKKELGEPPL